MAVNRGIAKKRTNISKFLSPRKKELFLLISLSHSIQGGGIYIRHRSHAHRFVTDVLPGFAPA